MIYEGCVDLAKEFVISGWAVNNADSNERVSVDIIINDELVATCNASVFREDLKDAGVSDGCSAFNFCPFYWLRRTENDVSIVYSGTKMALPGGHVVIGSSESTIDRVEGKDLQYTPKISIIMPVHNADTIFLNKAVESVLDQSYENWELCIVDDASAKKHIKKVLKKYAKRDKRIKVKFLKENRGISGASNEAASMTSGEYIAFLDHDDEIIIDALYEVVTAINIYGFDVIYSDENIINARGESQSLHFKPDFSPELLFSHNYITHFLTVRKRIFDEVGGFSSEYDGAQDYDLILKLSEKTGKIYHIPKVLYHWRSMPTSISVDLETRDSAENSGKAALQEALKRRKVKGEVSNIDTRFIYRVKRELSSHPLISIITHFKDKPELLERCVKAILHKTNYQNFEIIGLSNNSERDETFEMMTRLREADKRVRFHEFNVPFNYSKINNYAVTLARGEHIVLMHDDVDIISTDWIEALLEHSQRKEVGAVGAKLYYADDTIQHAGIIVGISGFAGHSQKHFRRKDIGYCNRLICTQNTSAVSAALLMVAKDIYEEIGGLDERNLAVSLNDVDFCLRLRERGYLNIFTPYCEAYHYESGAKDGEDTPEKQERFRNETEYFQDRWKNLLEKGDPYYNHNLTLDREDFTLRT